ncbi:amino acid permease [Paludibacterium denitrificans]|uniref:amino acid permease n=1 Tax=Paludibacterium denitrificans TaxID=2675226 RepID=UPI001E65C147|nr:amino acid permease [Paludibacterium denitrificans]
MAAEEAKDPKRTIPRAYIAGILTLVVLAMGVMVFLAGVGDWRKLANINDPLPQAMKLIVGGSSGWLHMLVWLGLFGLVASFHGIIMGYSRQIFALARAGFLPRWLSAVHPRFQTPHRAILAGGIIGIAAIFSDNLIKIAGQPLTANIVTLSVFGAIVMYIISMLSLFRLRKTEPTLERSYRAPGFPLVLSDCAGVCKRVSGRHGVLQPTAGTDLCRFHADGFRLLLCHRPSSCSSTARCPVARPACRGPGGYRGLKSEGRGLSPLNTHGLCDSIRGSSICVPRLENLARPGNA